MSQYKAGTVSVTNGSNVVTGVGTLFLANANVGDLFIRSADGVSYFVASKPSDTQITLTANYGGITGSGLSYVLHRDFITVGGVSVPLMQDGDLETVVIYNRMLQAMFEAISASALGTAAFANLTTSQIDTIAGRVLKVGDGGLLAGLKASTGSFDDLFTPASYFAFALTDPPDGDLSGNNRWLVHVIQDSGASATAGTSQFAIKRSNNAIYSRAASNPDNLPLSPWRKIMHDGILNNLEFENANGSILGIKSGVALSTTVVDIDLPIQLFAKPASITVVGIYDIKSNVNDTTIATGVVPILSPGASERSASARFAVVGADRNHGYRAIASGATKITVNP